MINVNKNRSFETVVNGLKLTIFEHGCVSADSEWKYNNINSPFNRLYFMLSGEACVENQNQELSLSENNIYLIPAGITNSYKCTNPFKKFFIHFNLELIPGIDIFEKVDKCLSMPDKENDSAELIIKFNSSHISDLLCCQHILLKVLSKFISYDSDEINNWIGLNIKYHKLFSFLSKSISSNLKITDLSEIMQISPSTLSKNFKIDMGMPLKKYLNGMLLQNAKQMLTTTSQSIKEVAFELGFNDELYFSKFFKKLVGIPPKEYRKINKF